MNHADSAIAFYFGYALPILCVLSGMVVSVGPGDYAFGLQKSHVFGGLLTVFIPFVNWPVLANVSLSNHAALVLELLTFWALTGIAIAYAIRRSQT